MNQKRVLIFGIFIFAIAFYFAVYFDKQIILFFSSIRNIYLSDFFLAIKFLDSWFFVIGLVTILFLFNRKKRKWILPAWVTLGVTSLVILILKISVQRTRPFAAGIVPILPGIVPNPLYLVSSFSFPSFDAAFAFCIIPLISKFYPKLKYFWIVFAGMVLLSRVYFGVHYLSDVISGAAIGFAIGLVILELEEKKKFFDKFYNKIFRKK